MTAADGADGADGADLTAADGAGLTAADGAHRIRVLIVGAAGQLGHAMVARLAADHAVTAWARHDLDLTCHREVRERILELAPAAVINCSGYNHVDRAEQDQETALDVNAFAVRTMARAAAELGAVLFQYSSDFVFSGHATTPYSEDDRPEPQSAYAQSKLVGEWMAADAPRHYVLRVESLFGGPKQRSSIDRIVNAVRTGTPAPVFVDRVVSPSFVNDVVDASAHLLRTLPPFGVYHCVNSGHAAWLDVGREIARILGKSETSLTPVHVRDVPLPAARPVFAALSNAKLARTGYVMPSWQDAIARYLSPASTA